MIKSKKLIVLIALCFVLALVGGLHAGAEQALKARTEGECWYYMNLAHDGAEIARKIGGDNQATLAYYGKAWTDYNNLRKQLVEQKQAEAQRQEEERKANMEYLGNWTLTAYANDGQSASGRPNVVGQTCACNCLPAGTVIEIEGMGRWTVTDRGASSGAWAWHNSAWADLYLGSESECRNFGVQKRNVWIVK